MSSKQSVRLCVFSERMLPASSGTPPTAVAIAFVLCGASGALLANNTQEGSPILACSSSPVLFQHRCLLGTAPQASQPSGSSSAHSLTSLSLFLRRSSVNSSVWPVNWGSNTAFLIFSSRRVPLSSFAPYSRTFVGTSGPATPVCEHLFPSCYLGFCSFALSRMEGYTAQVSAFIAGTLAISSLSHSLTSQAGTGPSLAWSKPFLTSHGQGPLKGPSVCRVTDPLFSY